MLYREGQKTMKNIIGKPVDGANFFGRDRELRELRLR